MQVVEVFVTRICRTVPTDLLPEAAPSHRKRLVWPIVQMFVELLRFTFLSDSSSSAFTWGPPLVSARISKVIC